MKTYFSNIIPKIQKYSKKLDDLTLLKNQNWVLIDDSSKIKNVFIFRDNNQVLISKNGKVKKKRWEYIGENNLLIELDGESYLFKHGFLDENIFALKMDSKTEYVFLINESKYEFELNNIQDINDFLIENYINNNSKSIDFNENNNSYEIKKINSKRFFLGSKTETYKVRFKDRLKGNIYVSKNKAYFKDNKSYSSELKRYYENPESCISALHHFLKTGGISKDGYIESILQ